MKLAEALTLRKEYQEKLENIRTRISQNIKAQEGDKPLEDPNILIKEAMKINDDMCVLIQKINEVNYETKLSNGMKLKDALTLKESILSKRDFLSNIASEAGRKDMRLTRSEIRMNVTVDVVLLQKEIDKLSKEYRMLDNELQSLNWQTEML